MSTAARTSSDRFPGNKEVAVETTTRMEVIDSDGHVIEPDVVWSEYAEPEFRAILDCPGGYVQATGIQRAYPDTARIPLGEGAGEGEWARAAEDEATSWDEESRHK